LAAVVSTYCTAWHVPEEQVSFEPQVVPSGSFDQVVVLIAGLQTWQASAEFTSPEGYNTPPIKQSATHAPEEQTSPEAQEVPAGWFDQVVVLLAGVQTWQ
jgi:hypothetical protein